MKFTTNAYSFVRELNKLSGIVSGRPPVPILNNFLFELRENLLTVYASDGQSEMRMVIKVEGKSDGNCCASVDLLMKLLRSMPDKSIDFHCAPNTFEISYDLGKYELAIQDYSVYPKMAKGNLIESVEIKAEVLKSIIPSVISFTGKETIDPALMGVLIDVQKDRINFVSSDRIKFSLFAHILKSKISPIKCIVPVRPLAQLHNSLEKNSTVKVIVGEKNIRFEYDNIILQSVLIDQKYPDYNKVFMNLENNTNILTIGRNELINTLKRVGILSSEIFSVMFTLSKKNLKIQSSSVDKLNKATEIVPCDYSGAENLCVEFNHNFLIGLIDSLESEEILIHFSDQPKPMLILPNEKNPKTKMVLAVQS